MLIIATLCLFVSSGSQMVAPLFFGKVIDAAQHSMGKSVFLLVKVAAWLSSKDAIKRIKSFSI